MKTPQFDTDYSLFTFQPVVSVGEQAYGSVTTVIQQPLTRRNAGKVGRPSQWSPATRICIEYGGLATGKEGTHSVQATQLGQFEDKSAVGNSSERLQISEFQAPCLSHEGSVEAITETALDEPVRRMESDNSLCGLSLSITLPLNVIASGLPRSCGGSDISDPSHAG
jgi:hypothetical protein